MAQLVHHLQSPAWLTGIQQSANLRKSKSGQGLSQPEGGAIRGTHLFRRNKIIPGGRGVVVMQMPLATLDESLADLLQQFPGALVSVGGWLAQKAMCLLQTPVLERLLCLS
jgi:hypothetical protein